jgi:oxepin-CoA hydrolase/3-oxo-5,6-dehydrosuberyl-CoA semialdehyde dehydrogenase
MNLSEKADFLQNGSFLLLQNLSDDSTALWGKMNARQMLEHLNDFYEVSFEKIIFPLITAEEHLPKYREFLYSEKPFKENTKAPAAVLGEEPSPIRTASLQAAKDLLKQTVEYFFNYFQKDPLIKTSHPVFGALNYDEWVMLHYKHVTHHFKQFNLLS